jgi:hypothetical protein
LNHEMPAPSPIRARSASDLIATLQDRAPRSALAFAAGQAAWPAVDYLRRQARIRGTYTVKVQGNDGIYDELHEWVLSLLPPKEQHALVAWSTRRTFAMPDDDGPAKPPALRLRYDGTREQDIRVAGHRIKVVVSEGGDENPSGRWKQPEIIFTARSAAARRALLAEIAGVLERTHRDRNKPSFRMLGQWDDWVRCDDLPPRTLDSVILPEGQLGRLVGDVGRWLAAEQDYLRRCIPWHRGHLYEGGPGTGKTSVARAIASHFGLDVWYVPLGDVKKDSDLLRLITRIGPRSVLLLEDVDVFHAATNRDDEQQGASLSGLLNSLDGIATPHGLLTIMTTNNPGVLDDALHRAGRIDLTEHFGPATEDQASRLISRYYGHDDLNIRGIHGITPADIVEACKRHDHHADAIAEFAGQPRARKRAA